MMFRLNIFKLRIKVASPEGFLSLWAIFCVIVAGLFPHRYVLISAKPF